ncbi:hypothetical protein QHH_04 [Halomonas phage QHHSV-1]|nr:hypothetical protein QHH_04 [Halomonas phage QHHSV-1]
MVGGELGQLVGLGLDVLRQAGTQAGHSQLALVGLPIQGHREAAGQARLGLAVVVLFGSTLEDSRARERVGVGVGFSGGSSATWCQGAPAIWCHGAPDTVTGGV